MFAYQSFKATGFCTNHLLDNSVLVSSFMVRAPVESLGTACVYVSVFDRGQISHVTDKEKVLTLAMY